MFKALLSHFLSVFFSELNRLSVPYTGMGVGVRCSTRKLSESSVQKRVTKHRPVLKMGGPIKVENLDCGHNFIGHKFFTHLVVLGLRPFVAVPLFWVTKEIVVGGFRKWRRFPVDPFHGKSGIPETVESEKVARCRAF